MSMKVEPCSLDDVCVLTPDVFRDDRGFFMEAFQQQKFEEACGHHVFVQDNHSLSSHGTLRGLHYQLHQPQGKLVRVSRGEVFDVAVDLRQTSRTYGRWTGVYLNDGNNKQLWIPPGFAHGFYVVSQEAEVQYKCTEYYNPDDEVCIFWNDPVLKIEWPLMDGALPTISQKDAEGIGFLEAPIFL